MENDFRLTAAMSSRKLQVVSFVQQYIDRWGAWPSYGEIGGAMGIASSTARDAVRRAVRDKLLHREPGSRKSVVKPRSSTPRLAPAEAAVMLERLREAGVVLLQEGPDPATPTFCPLPISPPFRHLPDNE